MQLQHPITLPPKYKIVFLGNIGVGKTAIINRFVHDTFDNQYQATIGVDFVSKALYLDDPKSMVRLELWDTAGQERYKALTKAYIRNAAAAFVVYDVTNRKSFDDADAWLRECRANCGPEVIVTLVGNKCDLEESRQVTTAELSAKAAQEQIAFAECSAKRGINVAQVMREAAAKLHGKPPLEPVAPPTAKPVKLYEQEEFAEMRARELRRHKPAGSCYSNCWGGGRAAPHRGVVVL